MDLDALAEGRTVADALDINEDSDGGGGGWVGGGGHAIMGCWLLNFYTYTLVNWTKS